jgi:hypothetical protein
MFECACCEPGRIAGTCAESWEEIMDSGQKQAILELLARAAYGYDEREVEMLKDSFSEGANFVIDIAGVDGEILVEGREAIMALQTGAMEEQSDKRRHVVTNVFFTSEGDGKATVVSNLTITSVEDGAIRLVSSGIYRDEVAMEDGQWRIVSRRLDLDMPY